MIHYNLRDLNHFFFLPLLRKGLCLHAGNILLCPLCLLWIWLSKESHFALINSPFPSGVDTADQYKWLIKLFFHSPTSSQSFSFDKALIFFLNAVVIEYTLIIIIFYSLATVFTTSSVTLQLCWLLKLQVQLLCLPN